MEHQKNSKKHKAPYQALFIFIISIILSYPFAGEAANKTLALFPLKIHGDPTKAYLREGVRSMFVSRVSGRGFEVIGDERIQNLLKGNEKDGLTSRDRAEELGRVLDADFILFGSITTIGSGFSLDLSLLNLREEDSEIKRLSEVMDENQFIPRMADVATQVRAIMEGKEVSMAQRAAPPVMQAKPKKTEGLFSKIVSEKAEEAQIDKGLVFQPTQSYQDFRPTGRISVGRAIMAFDMGDLDGDGQPELVALARKKLFVYKMDNESYRLAETFKPSIGEDLLKVSLGDLDQDERAEIFLVSRYGIRARTTILTWQGKFQKLDRKTGHIRVVRDPDGHKPLLLFQDSEAGGAFIGGDIHLLNYEGQGKTTRGEKLPRLKGVDFYTLARYDVNKDGNPEWFGLGDDARLRIWSEKGEVLWHDEKKMGGTNNYIRLGNAPPGDLPPRFMFNSRLVITDLDGDGHREILAIKNSDLIPGVADLKVYTTSKLFAYRMDGDTLTPTWTTRELKYCLVDMQVHGSQLYLAAQKGKMLEVTKGSGYIFWFN